MDQSIENIEREFRRKVNQLDTDWQRRFDDLDRRLRETKTRLEELDRRASADASGIGDGMMMVLAWAPLLVVLLALAAARR